MSGVIPRDPRELLIDVEAARIEVARAAVRFVRNPAHLDELRAAVTHFEEALVLAMLTVTGGKEGL